MINLGGRPIAHDLDIETEELDKWSKEEDATALCQFCVLRDTYPQKVYEWRDLSPKFAETLKKAKARIAARLRHRIDTNSKDKPCNYGLFMSEIGFHDQFHHDYQEGLKDKEYERKKYLIEHEAKIKSQVDSQTTEESNKKLDELCNLFKSNQSSCKIDQSIKSADNKS